MNDQFLAVGAVSIDWSSWVIAFATVVLVVITGIYAWLTKRIIDNQTSPCVTISAAPLPGKGTLIYLVIRNIGSGVAYDVSFGFNPPLRYPNRHPKDENAEKWLEFKRGPLVSGIQALGPGESRHILWGRFSDIIESPGDKPIIATCNFKRNIRRRMPVTQCPLEVDSIDGTQKLVYPTDDIVKEFKILNQKITSLITVVQKIEGNLMPSPNEDILDEGP